MNHQWSIGIGDSTFSGWLITLTYFVIAMICAITSTKNLINKNENYFWLLISFLLIFLGLNKQLDLQTLLIQTGRDFSRQFGWYEYRRSAQQVFIGILALTSIFSIYYLAKLYRVLEKTIKLAITGIIILIIFIFLRAATFNHINILSDQPELEKLIDFTLEFGAIVIIGYAATLKLKHHEIEINGSHFNNQDT